MNIISSLALCAQGFVVGTLHYKYFLYNFALKKFRIHNEPSLCIFCHLLDFHFHICRLL